MVFEREVPCLSPRDIFIQYLRRALRDILQHVSNGIENDCITFRLEQIIEVLLRSTSVGKYLKPRESGIESLCGGLRDALRDAFPYDAFPYDAFVYDAFPYDAFVYDTFPYDAFLNDAFLYDAFPYTMPLRILMLFAFSSFLLVKFDLLNV